MEYEIEDAKVVIFKAYSADEPTLLADCMEQCSKFLRDSIVISLIGIEWHYNNETTAGVGELILTIGTVFHK